MNHATLHTILDRSLESDIEEALADNKVRPSRPIAFIENKTFDAGAISRILQISQRAAQWANFGPVSRLLERCVANYLQMSDERAVVMCASGTAALFAIAAAHEVEAGRRLRWAVSSYGFLCTHLGPFSDAVILDCDDQGLLSFDALATLDRDTCDGVLLTNTFGLHNDLSRHLALCRERNMRIIVDNAAVLDGFPRCGPGRAVDEIVSFHQTKPWGMGEGGCAIVSRESASIVRSIINFGVDLPSLPRGLAANAKISDLACAAILNRLVTAPRWRPLYRDQARRIAAVAIGCGFTLMGRPDFDAVVPPHVPLLAPREIPPRSLENRWCVLQKYYKPLAPTKNAAGLYSRIVNVPCHPGMTTLSDDELKTALQFVLSGS
jgi:dTDP-4-amino-4,6-dideoxygalactose transaminase